MMGEGARWPWRARARERNRPRDGVLVCGSLAQLAWPHGPVGVRPARVRAARESRGREPRAETREGDACVLRDKVRFGARLVCRLVVPSP